MVTALPSITVAALARRTSSTRLGIVGREPRDLGLDRALRQAATQPLDQPGTEGVELGDFGDIDEDALRAAGELLGIGHNAFKNWRKGRGPGPGGAQRKGIALGDPFQLRIAAQDACSQARREEN